MNDQVYLKPNVVIEPLLNRWYCWSHLISPATAAKIVKERNLKIINSYIQAPKAHKAATKNPKLLGGPFMDYPTERKEDVIALKQTTETKQAQLLRLADAITELETMLKNEASGHSLDDLYAKIPEALRGYVELVYDLNNNPSYNIFESLLYKSEYYDESMQSVALWITDNDDRPFVLSTPRLDEDHIKHIEIPFANPAIDKLSRMKKEAGSFAEIAKLLDCEDDALFASFFTEEKPPTYQKYEGEHIRMRYFGHACILVETKDISILVDPLISYYGYVSEVDHFSDVDLPDVIDYVLITHNHQDHVMFETLLPLRHKIKNIIIPRGGNGKLQDPSLKMMFQNIGFHNVTELDVMESFTLGGYHITGVPFLGEHCDLNIPTKLCFHVKIASFSMLFVADSCNVENEIYKKVHQIIGDTDVIFLGMECEGAPLSWIYGPYLTDKVPKEMDQSRRLAGSNSKRGMDLVNTFNPSEVYVYAMGMEPWLKYISSIKYTEESIPIIESNALIKACEAKGIISERLFGEKEILYQREEVSNV
ncbi:MAG: MBL fold metallo-hydrolase [Bacteroidota bacterium]